MAVMMVALLEIIKVAYLAVMTAVELVKMMVAYLVA